MKAQTATFKFNIFWVRPTVFQYREKLRAHPGEPKKQFNLKFPSDFKSIAMIKTDRVFP